MIKEVNKDAQDFSGGEKQKLLLAKAVFKNAPVLILDEPTAALDPIAENELYLRYNELTKGKISFSFPTGSPPPAFVTGYSLSLTEKLQKAEHMKN